MLNFLVVGTVWVDAVLHVHVHQHQKNVLSFEQILQLQGMVTYLKEV